MAQVIWYPGMKLEELERQTIEAAIKHYKNNEEAARILGITERTLYNKLKDYKRQDAEQAKFDESEKEKQKEFLTRARGKSGVPVGGQSPANG